MVGSTRRRLSPHPQGFLDYFHQSRTHLRLEKDTPVPRPPNRRTWVRYHYPGSRRTPPSLRAPHWLTTSLARFYPNRAVTLCGLIGRHRPLATRLGHEAVAEAARRVACRRHRASNQRRPPLRNRKGCGIRSITRRVEVYENDRATTQLPNRRPVNQNRRGRTLADRATAWMFASRTNPAQTRTAQPPA